MERVQENFNLKWGVSAKHGKSGRKKNAGNLRVSAKAGGSS